MTDAFSSPDYQPHHPAPPYHPSFDAPSPFTARPWPPRPQPEPGSGGTHPGAPGRHSDLRLLRGAYRLQRRVATFTALGYFTVFLVLSAFVPSLMTGTVSGGLSLGLLLGVLQVPVTCLAIGLYEFTARRRVDPIAHRIRRQAEPAAGRGASR
ncbi:DUF485 domain-containing protein [Streptomyces sp. NPDC004561]